MSDNRTKTRSVSEETALRKLLVELTDHVLEMKEKQKKDNRVLMARLEGIDEELATLGRKVGASAMLQGDLLKKTNELHLKLLGSANGLGKRLYDLEQERNKRKADRPTRG